METIMRQVLYVVTSRNDAVLEIGKTLSYMGVDAQGFWMDSFWSKASYFDKKCHSLGYQKKARAYYEGERRRLLDVAKKIEPTAIIFINPQGSHIALLKALGEIAPLRLYFIDPLDDDIKKSLSLLPKTGVFTYDAWDKETFVQAGIDAVYLPIGALTAYRPMQIARDIDISFVGTPYGVRREMLDRLSKEGERRGWRLAFFGPFFDGRTALQVAWKKFTFKMRFPSLYQVVVDGRFSPEEIRTIYARSNICLNIDANNRAHFNPRTYDILAMGRFQLMDRHRDVLYEIVEGRDYIAYDGIENLIDLCDYYLKHEPEREEIARTGHESAKHVTMERTLSEILSLT